MTPRSQECEAAGSEAVKSLEGGSYKLARAVTQRAFANSSARSRRCPIAAGLSEPLVAGVDFVGDTSAMQAEPLGESDVLLVDAADRAGDRRRAAGLDAVELQLRGGRQNPAFDRRDEALLTPNGSSDQRAQRMSRSAYLTSSSRSPAIVRPAGSSSQLPGRVRPASIPSIRREPGTAARGAGRIGRACEGRSFRGTASRVEILRGM